MHTDAASVSPIYYVTRVTGNARRFGVERGRVGATVSAVCLFHTVQFWRDADSVG